MRDRDALIEEGRGMADLQDDQRMNAFVVVDRPDGVEARGSRVREAVRVTPGHGLEMPTVAVLVVIEPRRGLQLQRLDCRVMPGLKSKQ